MTPDRRPRRRSLLAVTALALTALAASPAAAAEGAFEPCPRRADGQCATLTVPLDRTGAIPGVVSLYVTRVHTSGAARGAIIPLAGGPGQAMSQIRNELDRALRTAAAGRDIVFFDQRGTGKSGLLRCHGESRSAAGADAAIRACADEIGPARSLYTTAQSVLDIESVRTLAAADRVVLYGVSYGTRVALDYARRFPDHVEALILDSVVPPEGSDPFRRSSFAAVKPALRAICARGACRGIAANPAADLSRLLARMGSRPLRGTFIDELGRPHRGEVTQDDVLDLLFAGDLDPTMRAVLPAALRSAVAGDSALLIRAVARQRVAGVPGVDNEEDLSPALFVTTVCEEEPVPWDRAAVLADRVSQSQAALAALPDTAFAPFGRAVGGGSPVLELCRNWPPPATPPPPVSPPPPAAPPPPVSPPPFPDVPVLAMGGKEDLRTPSTDALRVASLFPRGTFLEVPAVAHSVLASDPSGCADQAVRDFLAGRPVVRCTGRRRVVPPTPLPPSSVRALRPVPGVRGLPGKTLTAFARTLDDVTLSAVLALLDAPGTAGTIQAGGLRAGRFTLSRATGALELRGLSYVPGVVVSGRGKPGDSTWVISGSRAARGTLTLANGRVTGTLAGVAIDRPLAALRR